MLVFEKNHLRVRIFPDSRLMHTEWIGPATSEEFREGMLSYLAYINEYDIMYWIADARVMPSMSVAEQQWVVKNLVPQVVATNINKIAKISSLDIFNYMSHENIVQKASSLYPDTINFEQFTSYEAALEWIELS